ncbi:MAG: protoheme IX farnesyltransferase [Nitrospiraceae bacterium]|nr:protoheme IX farnesyltransferase [Nitrospiraceae bacterium]
MKRHPEKLIALTGLFKIRISLFAAVSAVASFFLLAPGRQHLFSFSRPAALAAGVLFLSFGASALNQVQEAATDALMERTRARPIPSGLIKPSHALCVSLAFISGGAVVLRLSGGLLPAAMGGIAVFLYNAVYTPLKKVTAFALIPGALVGAIPPAIGWVYGGGSLLSPELLIICFFFYIWQMPHFWLILLRYGGEYEKAGLPSITNIFSVRGLKRVIFAWEVCTAASAMLLAVTETAGLLPRVLFALPAAWIIGSGAAVFSGKYERHLFAWKSIDICVLAITCLLGAGRFLAA